MSKRTEIARELIIDKPNTFLSYLVACILEGRKSLRRLQGLKRLVEQGAEIRSAAFTLPEVGFVVNNEVKTMEYLETV